MKGLNPLTIQLVEYWKQFLICCSIMTMIAIFKIFTYPHQWFLQIKVGKKNVSNYYIGIKLIAMKLYKRVGDEILFWETWDIDNDSGAVNQGIVGQVGDYRVIKSSILKSFRKKIQKEVDVVFENGYQEVDIEDHYTLLIEFTVDGMGTSDDVDKRTRLQDRMNDFLGWNGLGYCDGGSIGSGTMEVCCFVIDFGIAKRLIEENLAGTEFAN